MRFGTFFRSEKQIKEMIRKNRGELVESFCRLRGKSEMRLRLLLSLASPKLKARSRSRSKTTASKTGPATSEVNRDALSLDPDSREMASRVATRMRDVFRPVEDQVKLRLVDNNQLMLDCTHLIDSERVQAYRKLPASASRQVKDLDIRMSGPWPPYHFFRTRSVCPPTRSGRLARRLEAESDSPADGALSCCRTIFPAQVSRHSREADTAWHQRRCSL